MSAIDTSCYTIAEKESGAGERNLLKTSCENSQIVATEIVNNLLDNAFDAVAAKTLQPTKIEKITPNVVGDILENINYRQDETVLLNDEIKQIIKDMKYPPDKTTQVGVRGVGDQLGDKSKGKDKILPESPKRNTLERKNRLTNLVKSSRQMLAKLTNNEPENEVRLIKSEEIHEKLIKVVDLDGETHLEGASCSATGILQMPPESSLHMVDLKSNTCEGGFDIDKSETEQAESHTGTKKKIDSNKKKWNLRAKIMKYLRKNKEQKKE